MDKPETDRDFSQNPFASIPVEILVSVGRARPLIRELSALGENAVLPLDRRIEDPVELYVGEQLVARGTLEEIEDEPGGRLGVRLSEILDIRQSVE
ncbi:MAG: FliM/FliN family flagellar motor switch protein [Paracoccaceae bacterium]